MVSALEMQHLIETAFLPATCRCEISPLGAVVIYVREVDQVVPEMPVAAGSMAQLRTSRAIAELVRDLKGEYQARRVNRKKLFISHA